MFNPFKKKPFEIDDFAKLVIAESLVKDGSHLATQNRPHRIL